MGTSGFSWDTKAEGMITKLKTPQKNTAPTFLFGGYTELKATQPGVRHCLFYCSTYWPHTVKNDGYSSRRIANKPMTSTLPGGAHTRNTSKSQVLLPRPPPLLFFFFNRHLDRETVAWLSRILFHGICHMSYCLSPVGKKISSAYSVCCLTVWFFLMPNLVPKHGLHSRNFPSSLSKLLWVGCVHPKYVLYRKVLWLILV